jgi:LPS sulfotransferase NodH
MSLQNSENTQKFVVLGTARTGSNLLMSLLNSYEGIKMYGELFNLDSIPPEKLSEVLNDPVQYAERKLSSSSNGDHKAIGFKMFYDHMGLDYFNKMVSTDAIATNLNDKYDRFDYVIRNMYSLKELNIKFKSIWNYLYNNTGLKIIHIKRRNRLAALISLKTAYATSEWMHWMPKTQYNKTTLHFDYEECQGYFSTMERNEMWSDLVFRNHFKLDIYYEDLVADKQQCINRVCAFLDLSEKPVKTLLKKQITYQAQEIIDNYDELKSAFEFTQWNVFFS